MGQTTTNESRNFTRPVNFEPMNEVFELLGFLNETKRSQNEFNFSVSIITSAISYKIHVFAFFGLQSRVECFDLYDAGFEAKFAKFYENVNQLLKKQP